MPLLDFNLDPPRPHLRTFGLACAAISAAVAALKWQALPKLSPALAGLAAVLAAVAFFAPRWLRWPFVAAMCVAYPIGFVVSWALLAVVYYLVVTPIGFVRRRLAGDPLQRTLDRTAATYWSPRPPPPPSQRYFRQY